MASLPSIDLLSRQSGACETQVMMVLLVLMSTRVMIVVVLMMIITIDQLTKWGLRDPGEPS